MSGGGARCSTAGRGGGLSDAGVSLMKLTLDNLKKFRGRGPDELRVRGAQAASAFAERRGWSRAARLPSDRELFRRFGVADAEGVLARFRARTPPRFFASFADADATRRELRERFGGAAGAASVARARRVTEGRFDLLGYRELSFGDPVDWHLEPVSARRAPLTHWSRVDYLDPQTSGDKKIVWELNRHQHFQTLGRAYWRTGDERFAETFAAHLASWMDANPPKFGINWASSLEVAFRSISWLWALHLFRDSPRLAPDLFARALQFLHVSARHLETYLSTYFSPNTHLTGEALGLYYLGTALPELAGAARWRETGRRILLDQLARQVRPDGVYFEQSTYYHRYTADFYTHFLLLSQLNGAAVEAAARGRLVALLDHLMYVTRPDGTTPFFGDDDGGRLVLLDDRPAADFRASLSNGAACFSRADYKFVAGAAAEETLWLFGAGALRALDRLPAEEPARASQAFPDGGYYVMRDGWGPGANYLMLDCGPHGAATASHGHAHADALSLVLSARGRTLLVDPGTYTYTGDASWRDHFRSSPAHNALAVDGESSSAPATAFRWRTAARARRRAWATHARFDYFDGEHDGYERLGRAVGVSRGVLFLKGDYWIVRDRAAAAPGARHAYALRFQFAPGAGPRVAAGEAAAPAREGTPSDAGLDLFAFGAGGAWREGQGWVSRHYGAREAAPLLSFEAAATGPREFHTFLLPRAAGAARAAVRRLDATGGRLFEISRGGAGHYDVLLASAGAYVESGRFASDFEWSWARLSDDGATVEELVLVNGRRFSFYGREIVRLRNRAPYVVARRDGERLIVETGAGASIVEMGEMRELAGR